MIASRFFFLLLQQGAHTYVCVNGKLHELATHFIIIICFFPKKVNVNSKLKACEKKKNNNNTQTHSAK